MADELDRDLLDELRAGWRGAAAPAPDADADSSLPADADTRAAVTWMRAAWAEVPIPAVPVVPAVPRGRLLRARFRRRIDVVAAIAASVLLALLAYSVLADDAAVRDAERQASDPEGDPAALLASLEPEPEDREPQDATSDAPTITALSPDAIELRSGPVTLVLVTSRPETANPEQAGPQPEEER